MMNLDEWAIVWVGGGRVVGRLRHSPGRAIIDDVFDLASQLQQGPGGQAMVIVQAFPVCLLPSLDTLDVTGCPRVMVSTLSKADQKVVSNAIEMGRQIAGGIKTAQSGIVLAPAGALPSGRR